MKAARSSDAARNIERLRRAASTGLRSCIEPLEKRTLLSVTAAAANTPPAVTPPGLQDVAVTEDAPNTEVDLWAAFEDAEDQDSQLTYAVTANTNAALFRVVSVDATTGRLVLNYTPDASGTADITVRATDNGTADSPPAFVEDTFTVTVAPVNDAPSFTKGGDQVAEEDSGPQTAVHWATDISPGPPSEASQQLTFIVTTDNPGLFEEGPAIAGEGTLTYTPAANATGTATVTVTLKDNGGTDNGGQDSSPPQTFTITIGPVDDLPTINRISNRVVERDSPPTTITVTGISPGPGEDPPQTVTLTAVSSDRAVVPDPVLSGAGPSRSLTFEPVDGATGTSTITVTATDSAGNSFSRSFTVQVVEEIEEPVADEEEIPVNTHTAGVQQVGTGQSIAADPDGNFVVTWASFGQGNDPGYGVYAQWFNASGVKVGPEVHVNTTQVDFQQTPSVAMDEDGNAVIVWQGVSVGPQGWDVYARRYGPGGTARSGEFRVNTFLADHQTLPSVAVDRDGDFVVAWSSRGQDGSGEGVYARRYNALGEAQGAEFLVNTRVSSDQTSPVVAAQPDGSFAVVWQGLQQDGSGWGVYAQRFSAVGERVGLEVRMNDIRVGSQFWPSIAPSAGGYVVAWSAARQDAADELGNIYVRRLDPSGPAPEGEQLVNTTTDAGNQLRPSVASDADGDFVVTWEGQSEAFPPIPWEFRAQRFQADGSALGAEIKLNVLTPPAPQPPPTSSYGVDVAVDAAGNIIAAWTSLDGSSFGVVARRFRVTDDPGPGPVVAVTGSEFLYEAVPHRLRLTFNADVSASLTDGDLTVRNVTTGQDVPVSLVSYDSATNVATFTFGGAAPNGNYQATLPSASVTGPGGGTMASDHVFEFYSLVGDVNRDRAVNGSDFAILAGNFGRTGTTFAQGDVNGDGSVNGSDFALLAGNFGKTVPPPPPPPAPLVAAASTPQSGAVAPAASPTPAAKAAAPKKARAQKKAARRALIKDRLRAARRAR